MNHPTCKEFAFAMGHDQAKTMGIPLTDQPLSEFIAERDARRERHRRGGQVALRPNEVGSSEMVVGLLQKIEELKAELRRHDRTAKMKCDRCGACHHADKVNLDEQCNSRDPDGAPCGGKLVLDGSPDEYLYAFQQETIAAFKPVLDWYDGDGEREWIPEMLAEAVADLQADRSAIVFATPLIIDYVNCWGAAHVDGCPGDDTCDCKWKHINNGINAAIDRLQGKS